MKTLSGLKRIKAIALGQHYKVHESCDKSNNFLFEGTRSACLKYLRSTRQMRAYKSGKLCLGQTVFENLDQLKEIEQFKRNLRNKRKQT